MSIFDRSAPFNPLPWIREKTLAATADAARLVDLANEPDTTAWYSRALREHASRLLGRLVPLTVLVHDAPGEAAEGDAWQPIVERGSLALARWMKDSGIEDWPAQVGLTEPRDGDQDDKSEVIEPEIISAEDQRAVLHKLEIYASLCRRMLREELEPGAQRLLLWLLGDLYLSPLADVVAVSRRFLPGDLGLQHDETLAAYRSLYEKGFIERVDHLPNLRPEALALRLLVPGWNESKHAAPYRPEVFGFEGDFVAGQRTIPGQLSLGLEDHRRRILERWGAKELLAGLRDTANPKLHDHAMMITDLKLSTAGEPRLRASIRHPLASPWAEVEERVTQALEEGWREVLTARPETPPAD